MTDGTELIGGQEKRDITIVDYDPAWPAAFAGQRDRILAAAKGALIADITARAQAWARAVCWDPAS